MRSAIIQALICHFRLSIESIELGYLVDFTTYFGPELADLQERLAIPILLITHDVADVEAFADQVVHIAGGPIPWAVALP